MCVCVGGGRACHLSPHQGYSLSSLGLVRRWRGVSGKLESPKGDPRLPLCQGGPLQHP